MAISLQLQSFTEETQCNLGKCSQAPGACLPAVGNLPYQDFPDTPQLQRNWGWCSLCTPSRASAQTPRSSPSEWAQRWNCEETRRKVSNGPTYVLVIVMNRCWWYFRLQSPELLTPVWLLAAACCCSPSSCPSLGRETPRNAPEGVLAETKDRTRDDAKMTSGLLKMNPATLRDDTLTSAFLCTKLRVMRSMCVYSVSSSKFLCSFSLFLVTSPNSTSSLCSCSCEHTQTPCYVIVMRIIKTI